MRTPTTGLPIVRAGVRRHTWAFPFDRRAVIYDIPLTFFTRMKRRAD